FCCDPSCVTTPTPTPALDAFGRRVFDTKNGQFLVVVEGSAALSGAAPPTSLQPIGPDMRPDLQIENTRDMGNGSDAVCDTGPVSTGGGGVHGIDPPSYAPEPTPGPTPGTVTGRLTDFACRFGPPALGASSACTIRDPSREPRFVRAGTIIQF